MSNSDTNWNVDLYNNKHGFVHQYGEQLIELLDPKPGELILDLGCGAGQLTNKIAGFGAKVIGLDSSVEMIESAKNSFPELEFYKMDAASFSFDDSFDAIFSNAALHWVTDQEKAIQCLYKNLKKNGRLVVEFGGRGNVDSILQALTKTLMQFGYEENSKISRWYFPSISEYTQLLEKQGFEVSLAHLYNRPTALESADSGIKDWVEMFGSHFFIGVDKLAKEKILDKVQKDVEDVCLRNGTWYADYRRIRVEAIKL
jgi:trans-aconitate methyltransferase